MFFVVKKNMQEKPLFAWSSGKDSALALHHLLESGQYEVAGLLTTITQDYDRVSMHGVRAELLDRQAESLGLALDKILISAGADNAEYERKMSERLLFHKARGVTHVAFGDIFLEDLRKYREDNLKKAGLSALFPIWKKDTSDLARTFISLGFKAVVTCVDTKVLGKEFCGREYDAALLKDLPKGVDPCGENGEFHSFAYAGPVFKEEIGFKRGEKMLRENRFYFCDLTLIPQPPLPFEDQNIEGGGEVQAEVGGN